MTQTEALAHLDTMVLESTRGWGTACTAPITRAVSEWCLWMGAAAVAREAPAIYFVHRNRHTHRVSGRVDVQARWKNGRQLSIEIDSAHKRASLAKLEHLQRVGHSVLWLRWDVGNRFAHRTLPHGVTTHFLVIAEPGSPGAMRR